MRQGEPHCGRCEELLRFDRDGFALPCKCQRDDQRRDLDRIRLEIERRQHGDADAPPPTRDER